MGCFNCIPVRAIARRSCCLLSSTKRIDLFRIGETRRGVEVEQGVGLRTSPKAWEEERAKSDA